MMHGEKERLGPTVLGKKLIRFLGAFSKSVLTKDAPRRAIEQCGFTKVNLSLTQQNLRTPPIGAMFRIWT